VDEMAGRAREVGQAIPPALVRQHALERFSLEHMAAGYVKLYQNILTAGQASNISALIEQQRAVA